MTKTNGCVATTNPIVVTVNANPASPMIMASGATTFCNGGTVTLTSSENTGNVWSNNLTTNAIVVNSSGTYDVTFTDANGCFSTSTATVVTVNANPPAPTIAANGPTTFCTGDSVSLTSSEATGNVWSNSLTTQSINVTSSGSFSVTHTDVNGCSATSNNTTVSVSNAPAPTIAIIGNTAICPGDSVVLTASQGNTYLWSNNATTQSITVNTAGSYFVTVTNTDPCNGTGPSASVTVTVNTAPTAAFTYTWNNTTVVFANNSVGGTTYNWNFGDLNSSVAQNPQHLYTPGTYIVTLTTTNAVGCTSTVTDTVEFNVGVQESATLNALTLYPNPANENVNLTIDLNTSASIQVMAYDMSGKILINEYNHLSSGKNVLTYDVMNWSNGIYFIQVTSLESVNTMKVVINR